jgi:glycosyltransferase involved in cell wall biosynthesis
MKIVHFPATFLPNIGGAEIATHNIALQQHQAGHRVAVISTWKSWRAAASLVPYKVIPLLPKSITWVLNAKQLGYDTRWLVGRQLEFYQRIYDFDVWHVHMAYHAGFVVTPMLKRMRLPCVVTCHGADIQKMPEIDYGLRLDPVVEQEIVQTLCAFDRVTAVSESIHSEYLQLGIPPGKIRDVPNGVNAHRIIALSVDRSSVRAKMGWPPDKIILLTVGRNHPKKGYGFIPEIIKQVAAVRRDFLWVIVGRGVEPIAEMARALGVGEYLRVLPQIGQGKRSVGRQMFLVPSEELVEIYKAADVFVFPSLLESFGMVLVEAMAAQLPIVTTDAPGCRDVVEAGVTGLTSSVGDTLGMVGNILRLLASPALMAKLGRNGELNSREYEWGNVASHYCTVYEELVGEA